MKRLLRWLSAKAAFLFSRCKTEASKPSESGLSRRRFFTLAGAAVLMAKAAPGLLLEPAKAGANLLSSTGAMRTLTAWPTLEERMFYQIITSNVDSALLPNIPEAADGEMLFLSTSYDEVSW